MSYGAIQLDRFGEVIIAELVQSDSDADWTLRVPPFPDLNYEGWTLRVPKARVIEFQETTELMALAYLRAALPPMPDLERRTWRGPAKIKMEIPHLNDAYASYVRAYEKRSKKPPKSKSEFESAMREILEGKRR